MLRELLRPRQPNNLIDGVAGDGAPENKYTDDGPDAAAIKKTPGAYITNPVTAAATANGDAMGVEKEEQDTEMTDVIPVKKSAPVTPEVQALNVALKEVARMLAQALPISKRLRLASSFGMLSLPHVCTCTCPQSHHHRGCSIVLSCLHRECSMQHCRRLPQMWQLVRTALQDRSDATCSS